MAISLSQSSTGPLVPRGNLDSTSHDDSDLEIDAGRETTHSDNPSGLEETHDSLGS
jgi:hypothetical protein